MRLVLVALFAAALAPAGWDNAASRTGEYAFAWIEPTVLAQQGGDTAGMTIGAFRQPAPTAHEARILSIQASGDANTRAFQHRMAAMDASHRRFMEGLSGGATQAGAAPPDASHRRFINVIRGEHTVATPSGLTLQVDNSHQRYFVDEASGRYVGGDAHADRDSLRGLGLDPDAYVEAEVRY